MSHVLVTGWLRNGELLELTEVRGSALLTLLFVLHLWLANPDLN